MKHYPVENVYLYTSRHFPLVPIQKSSALCHNCLLYSTSLISNNYLGSNNCHDVNNFHFLVNVLFPIALMFTLLSVWNIIQLRMSIFALHVISALVPIQKSSALWDNCLDYSNLQFLTTIKVQTTVLLIITFIYCESLVSYSSSV